jgi:kynurenine formamidase
MPNDNGPTHIDSFNHLDPDPDALTIDQIDLGLFYGPAICIDVSHIPEMTDITAERLDGAWRHQNSRSILEITVSFTPPHMTNTQRPTSLSPTFAGLGESGAQWIPDKGIKTFGGDSPTPDNPTSKIYPIHLMCRYNQKMHYENLILT